MYSVEKTTPVDGHAYADITAGPRNGMFINTSGNKRDGQAFVLVKRDGKEFHIYGSGKDRLVVCLKRKEDADETASAASRLTTPYSRWMTCFRGSSAVTGRKVSSPTWRVV